MKSYRVTCRINFVRGRETHVDNRIHHEIQTILYMPSLDLST